MWVSFMMMIESNEPRPTIEHVEFIYVQRQGGSLKSSASSSPYFRATRKLKLGRRSLVAMLQHVPQVAATYVGSSLWRTHARLRRV